MTEQMLQENEEILNRFMMEGFKRGGANGAQGEETSSDQVSDELSEAGDATALQADDDAPEEGLEYTEPA